MNLKYIKKIQRHRKMREGFLKEAFLIYHNKTKVKPKRRHIIALIDYFYYETLSGKSL